MSLLDALRHRWYVVRRGDRYSLETQRELRFHLDLDALAAGSMGREAFEAELIARRALGSTTYYREEVRQMTSLRWLDRFRQDLSYAWRGLMRAPVFGVTVVLTLGLGLGVNAAMYSFLDRVFFRPPDGVVAPREVRRLFVYMPGRLSATGGKFIFGFFNYPQYRAMQETLGPSGALAGYTNSNDSLSLFDGHRVIPSRRVFVTASYFHVLGVRSQVGRLFTADEDRVEGTSPVAVISHALWQRAFDGNADVLGKTVKIGKQQVTIVGVAPAGFAGVELDRADVWLPMNMFDVPPRNGKVWYLGSGNYLRVFGRLPDASAESRVAAIGSVAYRRGTEAANARPDTTSALLTGPLAAARGPGDRQQELTISTRLAGVALVVLLIACANVANLLVVRAMSRRREIAVRRALGVSSRRLFWQLMTESLLLVTISSAFALMLALWVGTALRRMLLPNIHWADGAIDSRVMLFTAVAALVTGFLTGLAPVVQAIKPDLINSLRAGSREAAYRRSRLRSGLLVVQAALSIVLIVGAGVFVRSLRNVEALDIGYDTREIMWAQPVFENDDQASSPAVGAAMADAVSALASINGIDQVAGAYMAPMRGNTVVQMFLPGRDSIPKLPGEMGFPTGNSVSPEYFATTGLRLIAGRTFDRSDRAWVKEDPPSATVVSTTMARMFWPGESAVGKCIVVRKKTNPCTIVVGVVDDGRTWSILDAPPMQYYFPLGESGPRSLILRSHNAGAITEQVRRVMAGRFPTAQNISVKRMTESLEPQMRPWRLGANLFSAMGLLALIVSAIGIYSVVSYAASQRTHEMGVRIALGAKLSDVLKLIVYEACQVVGIGIAFGIVASLALGRFVASLLYGVSPYDMSTLTTAVLLLGALGFVASVIPGWRAGRADPLIALRAD